ncbi:MAG: JAB domain-containing protein [Bdellovibrionales bacterium]|nr:JAB domain-containing protein [Bdellovibrionales bacterium]
MPLSIRSPLRRSSSEWIGFIPRYKDRRDGRLRILNRGSPEKVDLDPRVLFQKVFNLGAHGFILVHNHPSGRTDPSQADLILTDHLMRLSLALGVPLQGHAIVTRTKDFWIQLPEICDTDDPNDFQT